MPKTYPQVGCYDGGEASKHALQICWRVQHISLSYEQQRYQDRSRKHWKRLKVNNVKHGDTKKEDQQVEAILRSKLKLKRSWMQAAEQLAKTVKGLNQMTFLEKIYPQVAAIRQISTDEFSKDFLGMGASYYRSMKARGLEPSTAVLVTLMERLGEQAIVMKSGKQHSLLLRVAERYEAVGEEVGREIARRSLQQAEQSKWVRETLLRIISNINSERVSDDDTWSAPPIIIC